MWGIGPSKIQPGSYGPEMIEVLEEEEAAALLARSVQDARDAAGATGSDNAAPGAGAVADAAQEESANAMAEAPCP